MTLSLYLSRVVGAGALAATLALVAIGLGIDLLDSATDLLDAEDGPGLALYAALRAPTIASSILLLGILAGAAAAFLRLRARSELTVLRAAGLSLRGALLRLAPLALLLGAGFAALAYWAAPAAERALALSYAQFAADPPPGAPDDLWARTPSALIRARGVSADGATLGDVTLFELTPEGALAARTDAARAIYAGGVWTLEDGARRPVDAAPRERFETRVWPGRLAPADLLRLRASPETVTPAEARAALAGLALAVRSPSFYEVRTHRAPAALVKPFLMLLFAAPLGVATRRGGGAAGPALLGLALGVAFLGFDGVAASLGERGVVAPAAAVWTPPLVFALLGFWALLLAEE